MDGITGAIDISVPLSYSYNYLSIVSNMSIPIPPGYIDLLAISGPIFSVTGIKFDLTLKQAKPGYYGIEPATREHFFLRRPVYNRIIVAVIKPLQGPQDIELELLVSLYNDKVLGGSTKALINIVVSEYRF